MRSPPPSRRGVLQAGAASLLALRCGAAPRARPAARPPATYADGPDAERGHRLWGPAPAPRRDQSVAVAIVGAGVAGLTAAWRLAAAGLRDVVLVELADQAGGTARSGEGPGGPFPWGAHYLTLPNPEARVMRRLLRELGVIQGFDADGRPRYDELAVVAAPEERLWNGGRFTEGLWPSRIAGAEALSQRTDFEAEVARLRAAVGADGRPYFTLPLDGCSWDPVPRALVARTFADWLDAQGWTDPVFRWWVEYGCRDDYGTTLEGTSAWAGLHYHCARRPDPALALSTHVLTWPAGNGWMVEALRARSPYPLRAGAVVRSVEPGPPARLVVEEAGDVIAIQADQVVLAVPTAVAGRLLGAPRPAAVDAAPWRVAAIEVSTPPRGAGSDPAWDTVIYGAASLGYVQNRHQTHAVPGRAVLSWYEPLTGPDPRAERRRLLEGDPEADAERVLAELRGPHPDIDDLVLGVQLWRWGHGTARPVPGLHDGRLAALQAPVGAVSFAHTDLSGLSLFEEAAEHGVRAAEEVLAARGLPFESWR